MPVFSLKRMRSHLLIACTVSLPAIAAADGYYYVHEMTYRTDRFSAQYCKCYSVSKAQVLAGTAHSTIRQRFGSYGDAAAYRNALTQRPGVCGGCSAPIPTRPGRSGCTTIFGLPANC